MPGSEAPKPAAHLPIGEVLSLLQSEFPDVTISKIRFLESQGLVAPERTPSGYRKFLAGDIARLRWILRCQRDQFLPLRVIKARLESGEDIDFDSSAGDVTLVGDQPELFDDLATSRDLPQGPGPTPNRPAKDPAAWLAALQESPPGQREARRDREAAQAATVPLGPSTESLLDGARYTVGELAVAAGLSEDAIGELIEFGLIVSRSVGGVATFDGHAVSVARSCRYFIGLGIGPRHLRMYKLAADREAGFFEQLIMPLLRQRNPRARQEAVDRLSELIERGENLRLALVTQALRDHLGS